MRGIRRTDDQPNPSRGWRYPAAAALLVAGALLNACANRDPGTETRREYLDPLTGVTITALAEPLILAHAEPRLSSSLRDYLYAGPVEVNRMGKRSYYLWIAQFSTLDRAPAKINRLTLEAGETVTELDLPAEGGNAAEIKTPPYTLPLEQTSGYYIPVSAELLINLAAAESIVIDAHTNQAKQRYSLWRGEPAAMRQFTNSIASTPAR